MSDFLQQSGGLPSAETPFSMDLATPIMAISQQMVKRRRDEIASDKSIINENESMMLKALDFETVKGLSDRIQEEHVTALDDLKTKWAERYSQTQGKFTNRDKLELTRDQRQVETDIANKKANVLAFQELQKFIQTDPKAKTILDVDATTRKMAEWADSGKIGDSGASFLAVPRDFTGAEIVMEDFGKLIEETSKKFNEEISNAGPGKVMEITETYGKKVDAIKDLIKNSPRLQDPDKLDQGYKTVDAILGDVTKDRYVKGFAPPRPRGSGSGAEERSAEDFNKTMSSAIRGDKKTLDIVTYKIQAKGYTTSYDADGKQIATFHFPDGRKASMHIIDDATATEQEKRTAAIEYSSIFPSTLVPKDTKMIDPDAQIDPVVKSEPSTFALFDDYLSPDNANSATFSKDSKGNDIPNTRKKGWRKAIDLLKKELPEGYVVKETSGLGDWNNIKITDSSGKSKTFDWTEPDDVEDLKEFFRKHSNSGAGYNKATKGKTEEGVKQVEEKDESDPLGIL